MLSTLQKVASALKTEQPYCSFVEIGMGKLKTNKHPQGNNNKTKQETNKKTKNRENQFRDSKKGTVITQECESFKKETKEENPKSLLKKLRSHRKGLD